MHGARFAIKFQVGYNYTVREIKLTLPQKSCPLLQYSIPLLQMYPNFPLLHYHIHY